MHIVLVEPEIPQNTGNVARTCVMTSTRLHLIEPLGFSIADKDVRRSGLDYWKHLELSVHPNFEAFKTSNSGGRHIYFSTKGKLLYADLAYLGSDYLIFGSETKGLSPDLLQDNPLSVRIPMNSQIPRSLNLGNSVAIVLYEALRQLSFPEMS